MDWGDRARVGGKWVEFLRLAACLVEYLHNETACHVLLIGNWVIRGLIECFRDRRR